MSNVFKRQIRTYRNEYCVPLPAARADVLKAQSMASRDIEDSGANPAMDDAYRITADDENLIIYWEENR